jgi:glycerophosphoryl diester phosphodiesterase
MKNPNHEIMIAAHRGASYARPENTIPALQLAFKEKADFIEGDFWMTKDNEIVCIHDSNTRRITNGKSNLNIRTSNLSDLKKLNSFSIPTLMEILQIIPKGKGIIIEIKDNRENFIKRLITILNQFSIPSEKIRIIAFKPQTVRRIKKYLPYIKVYLLFGWYFSNQQYLISLAQRRLKQKLKTLTCDGVDLNAAPYINNKLVSYLRQNKLDFCTYNVDKIKDAELLMKLGVDLITTNSPKKMRKFIASF